MHIIQNLVTKILRVHPEYTFDLQTMDLHLAPEPTFQYPWPMGIQSEDLSSPLLYHYPNTEGKIGCYMREFVVRKLVVYLPHSGVLPSPSPLVLSLLLILPFPCPIWGTVQL